MRGTVVVRCGAMVWLVGLWLERTVFRVTCILEITSRVKDSMPNQRLLPEFLRLVLSKITRIVPGTTGLPSHNSSYNPMQTLVKPT